MRNLTIATLIFVQILTGCKKASVDETSSHNPNAENPIVSIPIQRNSPWIVDDAIVGGQKYSLLLDTGVTWTFFNVDDLVAATPLAQEAEASLINKGIMQLPSINGQVDVVTPSGDKKFALGLTPAIHIQDWLIPPDELASRGNVTKFSSLIESYYDKSHFNGILGIGLMKRLIWRVDYVSGRLMAYSGQSPAHEWKQCTFMTLSPGTQLPLISAKVNNQLIFIGIDTGDLGDISMTEEDFDFLSKAGQIEEKRQQFYSDITHESRLTYGGLVSNFSIGHEKFPKLSVSVSTSSIQLGIGALSKMDRFEFDFRNYRFCFDPSTSSRDSVLNKVGAILLPSHDFYEVKEITTDGLLALSGVKKGDVIRAVDGSTTKGIKGKDLYDMLNDPATSKITISRAGKIVMLKIYPRADQQN